MAAASRKTTRPPRPAKAGSKTKTGSKAKTGTKARPKAKPTAKSKIATETRRKAKPGKRKAAKAKTAKPKSKTVKSAQAKPTKPRKIAAAKTPPNRRRFDRRATSITARLEHAGAVTAGTVTNLSLEGCLFAPQLALKPGSRIKLYLASEAKPVAATVKAVSDQGVHCLLHAGGVTLGRLSTDLDDMALLMLKAGRPHEVALPAESKPKRQ